MFKEFFNKLDVFKAHHQVIFALVAFIGASAFLWAVTTFFNEYFLTKQKRHYQIFWAAVLGLTILFLTHTLIKKLS